MNYKKIAESIRICGSNPTVDQCKNCSYWLDGDMTKCIPKMTSDAASAIEELLVRAEKAERERIADIEDILGDTYDLDRLRELVEACKGLEPEEIKESKLLIATRKDPEKIARVAELVNADKDGRCVVLPCKLHDKIFLIENGQIKETEAESFHNWTSGVWKISTHTDRMFDHWKGYEIDFRSVGKIAFITKKDAEQALERMKGNG